MSVNITLTKDDVAKVSEYLMLGFGDIDNILADIASRVVVDKQPIIPSTNRIKLSTSDISRISAHLKYNVENIKDILEKILIQTKEKE